MLRRVFASRPPNYECARSLSNKLCESRFEVTFATDGKHEQAQPQRILRLLQARFLFFGNDTTVLHEHGDEASIWDKLMQQFGPLGRQANAVKSRPCDVSARPIKDSRPAPI